MKKIMIVLLFILTCFSIGYSTGLLGIDGSGVENAISYLFEWPNASTIAFDTVGVGVAFGITNAIPVSEIPVDEDLTPVAITYKEKRGIADDALPYVQVDLPTFKYKKAEIKDAYELPDTNVGRTSSLNSVTSRLKEESAICLDQGLFHPIPEADLSNASAEYRLLYKQNAVNLIMSYIARVREVRVRNILFNTNSYALANQEVLSGSDQFSDYTSDALKVILLALDIPLIRPNIMQLGQTNWTTLRLHPDFSKVTVDGKIRPATKEEVAETLEIDKLLVGEGRINTAQHNLDPVIERLWQNDIALTYIPDFLSQQSTDTFGFTGRYGQNVAGETKVPLGEMGLLGGNKVVAGQIVKEVVVESRYGYYIKDAFAAA